jgi:hypothetical protein
MLQRLRLPALLPRTVLVTVLTLVLGILFISRQTSPAQAAPLGGVAVMATPCPGTSPMQTRFIDQWQSMIRSASGTLNPNGYLKVIGTDLIPYHSIETFMVEAPDQGHELSSETWSYMLWLAAQYANYTGDFSYFQNTWNAIEKYAIPSATDQPNGGYNPSSPAQYAGEYADPSSYPAPLNASAPSGSDPFYNELFTTYGNKQIYGMHWLFDGDNFYGFGNRNDGTSPVAYINTFQRGPQESTWETIPQPSWDTQRWGMKSGSNYLGFGTYFVGGVGDAAKKYSYTNAPDADARAVQAAFLAKQAAAKWGVNLNTYNAKAAKLGDYLRYAMAEKYFKAIPCASMSINCPGGSGKNMLHYLISWYYAWGGDASGAGSWSWRIGDYAAHFGYQNPMAAWVLANDTQIRPLSPTAPTDWATSLNRQLDLYQWLQSAEGAIAGGAEFGQVSNTGSYSAGVTGIPKFNGLTYVANPVYLDPGSNTWFGFQAWSVQRLAEYYYNTGNAQAGAILNKWANWIKTGNVFHFIPGTNGEDVEVASTISWSGLPAGDFNSGSGQPPANPGLHITIVNYGQDMGTMASAANALTWYAAATAKWGTLDTASRDLAKRVLDAQWNNHRNATGVVAPEARGDYSRFFNQIVYVPSGTTGKMPLCSTDCIAPGVTFFGLRPQYASDPDFARVQAAVQAGTDPVFTYHRFWAQTDIAMANGFWGDFFDSCGPSTTPTPTATRTNTPVVTATRTNTPTATNTVATFQPPTSTATRTNTPVVTATRTNTPTSTNTGVIPSATRTSTNTATRTNTPAVTATRTNTPTVTNTSTPGGLQVQVQNGGADSTQQSQFRYKVVNTGSTVQSNISVRLYITTDNAQPISKYVLEKYWDQSGVVSISGPTLVSGNLYYYTFSYGATSLAPGVVWEYQGALHLNDWTNNFDGANDWWHTGYAMGSLPGSFVNTNYIPAYVNGSLVWGSTP